MEYRLPNDYLRHITLVDMSGTVVAEHQARTAEYMRLAWQLRTRHDQEKRRMIDIFWNNLIVRQQPFVDLKCDWDHG